METAQRSQASTTHLSLRLHLLHFQSSLRTNYVRLRAEAQEDEKFLSGDESGAAMGRQCFDPQVSSVNLRTVGWTSPLLHPIGVSVSNAVLAIVHCLWVAAHHSAFLSFSQCNSNVHLVFFGATACSGCLFFSSSPEELKCAVRLSLNTGSTFGNLTPLPANVRWETLWRSWQPLPSSLVEESSQEG